MSWEFATLRKGAKFPERILGRGKVTARYSVQMSPTKLVRCVRVRFGGVGVFHFSETEFKRLFDTERE